MRVAHEKQGCEDLRSLARALYDFVLPLQPRGAAARGV